MPKILIPTKSAEDWKALLVEPEKQWRTGFSARTLAYCWQESDGFPESVKSVFSEAGNPFSNLEPLLIIPEHKVPLPGGERPSQNDIWILAKSCKDLLSIAVEGKVTEPFGPTIEEWLDNDSKGKQKRLEFLINKLSLEKPVPRVIRYQLLHRTVSAIIEAERFNTSHAMMMVHSFSQNDQWFEDYQEFLSLFSLGARVNLISSLGEINRINLHFSWIRGEQRYLRM